uniref:VWFD domain-containing protein n=1 Tax=Malurus cyaneus samueli TaxID=2593467 RepID=A0A8C5TZI0_9PASS
MNPACLAVLPPVLTEKHHRTAPSLVWRAVHVTLASSSYKGKLCGLCGTYTGSQQDDFMRPDGVVVPDFNNFGASWMEVSKCSDSISPPVSCSPSDEEAANKQCAILTHLGIFKDCHAKVPPQNFFENCVYDMCFTGGQATSLCYGLQAYAESCVNAGICIEWRNATLCRECCYLLQCLEPASDSEPFQDLYKPLIFKNVRIHAG